MVVCGWVDVALPRFDAHVRRVGLGPNSEVREAREVDRELVGMFVRAKGEASWMIVEEDEGVVCEEIVAHLDDRAIVEYGVSPVIEELVGCETMGAYRLWAVEF